MYTRLGNPVGLAEIESAASTARRPQRPMSASDERRSRTARARCWRSTRRRPRSSSRARGRPWGELAPAADAVDAALRDRGPRRGRAGRAHAAQPPGRVGALLGLLRAGACVVTVNPLLGAERLRADLPRPRAAAARSVRADDLALLPPDALPCDRSRRARCARRADRGRCAGAMRRPSAEAGRASRSACSPAARPGRRSASTSRYEMLDQVMRGAKHYETRHRQRRAAPRRRRHRQRAAGAPRAACSACVQAVLDGRRSPCSSASPSTGGPTRCAAPAQDREPRAHRAAHGARRRPRRRRFDERPVGRVGHRAARSRRRRRVHRAVRRAGADVVRRHRVRRRRRRLEPRRPRAVRAPPSGAASVARTPGASCASSIPTTAPTLGLDEDGLLEVRAAQLGADDWVRTTDLARIDADGFLWILGRADQTIIRGGFKVQPEVVRAALERDPAVAEAAVVGVDDERLGAVPVAAVERRPGARARRGATVLDARGRAPGAVRGPGRRSRSSTRCRAPRRARSTSPPSRELFAERPRRRADDREHGDVGRSASRRCPTVVELAGALRALTEHRPLARAVVTRARKRWSQTVRARSGGSATQAPADPRPRVGDEPSPDQRVYVDHGYDVGDYNPCFPRRTSSRSDGRRCARHRRVPGLLRRPARDRARRVPRGVLRLRAAAAQLRRSASRARPPSSRSGSGDRRRCSPPLAYRAERVVDGSRITARRRAAASATSCSAKREMVAAAGRPRALPTVSPRRP